MADETMAPQEMYGIEFIKRCQRNRYPLLFLDRVTEISPGVSVSGVKCFSYNEWFFPAHFEDNPVVPGFVLLEALTQTFLMTFLSLPEYQGEETAFLTIREAKFTRKVIPADVLSTHAELKRLRFGIAEGSATGHVGADLACQVQLSVAIPSVLLRLQPQSRTGDRGES
jgi:3-hydroxyacyl-[acyl-carrier-protein] dehydratase